MVQALISGEVLRWARLRAGASLDSVAEKLKVSPEDVTAWEEERSLPSFAKARDAAKYLRVPFGYLFLDKPPAETIAIPDLRRIGGEPVGQLGPNFTHVYQDAIAKQNWYREYLIHQGFEALPFVGSRTIHDDPAAVASDMRRTLDVTTEWRRECSNWEAMFRGLVAKTEKAGVLVLRNSIVGNNTHRPLSVREFRGFALSDPIAPLIFINSADATAAQIFSLAHELAHIWLNISAISNFGLNQTPEGYDPLEVFCNRVAAEFLVARNEFLENWKADLPLDQNADVLSREFRVSTLVIARRALDLGRIAREEYFRFYERAAEAREQIPEKKGKGGGPDFYTLARIRNSATFARAVLTEALEGRLLLRDAGQLLSVKPAKLKELAKELGG
jgi:Zn-dependent peptidase ImmA (M78 family)/DNA-binding XRE family transcriptional regulator